MTGQADPWIPKAHGNGTFVMTTCTRKRIPYRQLFPVIKTRKTGSKFQWQIISYHNLQRPTGNVNERR